MSTSNTSTDAQTDVEHPSNYLQHHFDTPTQQFETAKLGMWVFIVTEILMFGGLFVAYFIFNGKAPGVFKAAHEHLNKEMGAINTIVLLFSSLTAALAVRSSQLGKRNHTSIYLVVTILCACGFLVIKYFEYTHKLHEGLLPGNCFGYSWCHNAEWAANNHTQPELGHFEKGPLPRSAQMFFAIYFMMTGLHGVHVVVGMSVLGWVLWRNIKDGNAGKISKSYFTPVEIGALYWHLVDLVWIYLFPLLYLVG